jgi:EAL domain-containing protein (putative c-di-GMP-specific phosphodiesterase class I)
MQNRRHVNRRLKHDRRDDPLSLATRERDKDILKMVEDALRGDQSFLVYQPVQRADRRNKVAFYEGLIRLQDETGRVIPAREFISEVEDTELGRLIDCAALQRGIQALSLNPALRLSVNMSARSIGYRRWSRIMEDGLASDPTLGERLILEISEASAMSMPEIVISFMDEMQSSGVSFALDDFGAGFTSFQYFNKFFFDILKIDGQFIRNIHKQPDTQVLTRALINMGHHFEMFTVAENVETEAEASFLRQAGIDCLQGYLFGAPGTTPPAMQLGQKRSA